MKKIMVTTLVSGLCFGGTPFRDYNLGVSTDYTKIENQVSVKCVKHENNMKRWNECKARVIRDLRGRKANKK